MAGTKLSTIAKNVAFYATGVPAMNWVFNQMPYANQMMEGLADNVDSIENGPGKFGAHLGVWAATGLLIEGSRQGLKYLGNKREEDNSLKTEDRTYSRGKQAGLIGAIGAATFVGSGMVDATFTEGLVNLGQYMGRGLVDFATNNPSAPWLVTTGTAAANVIGQALPFIGRDTHKHRYYDLTLTNSVVRELEWDKLTVKHLKDLKTDRVNIYNENQVFLGGVETVHKGETKEFNLVTDEKSIPGTKEYQPGNPFLIRFDERDGNKIPRKATMLTVNSHESYERSIERFNKSKLTRLRKSKLGQMLHLGEPEFKPRHIDLSIQVRKTGELAQDDVDFDAFEEEGATEEVDSQDEFTIGSTFSYIKELDKSLVQYFTRGLGKKRDMQLADVFRIDDSFLLSGGRYRDFRPLRTTAIKNGEGKVGTMYQTPDQVIGGWLHLENGSHFKVKNKSVENLEGVALAALGSDVVDVYSRKIRQSIYDTYHQKEEATESPVPVVEPVVESPEVREAPVTQETPVDEKPAVENERQ